MHENMFSTHIDMHTLLTFFTVSIFGRSMKVFEENTIALFQKRELTTHLKILVLVPKYTCLPVQHNCCAYHVFVRTELGS